MSVGAVNKQTGERIPTAGMPAIDSVLSGSSTNPVQNRVVKAALDEKADTDIVASDFDATASYTAGNYCIYEGKFYRFKAAHSGAWAAADVDEIKIAGELFSLMSGLTHLESGTEIFTDLTAGSNEFVTVYFDRAYTSAPIVMATIDADGVLSGASCAVRDITTTTAKIYARNSGTSDATIKVNWGAIGI